MVMHASLRTNDDHEDHMESTRDETPSLQLSMANWHAGGRLLLLILRVAPALSALSCVVFTIKYVVLASASLDITLLTVFIRADGSHIGILRVPLEVRDGPRTPGGPAGMIDEPWSVVYTRRDTNATPGAVPGAAGRRRRHAALVCRVGSGPAGSPRAGPGVRG